MNQMQIDPVVEFREQDSLISYYRNRNLILGQQLQEALARIAAIEAAAAPTATEEPPAVAGKSPARKPSAKPSSTEVADGEAR